MIKKIVFAFLVLSSFQGSAQTLFQTPKMSFIHSADEIIIDVSFSNPTSLENVQKNINSAHSQHSGAIIRVTITGDVFISKQPLVLSGKTILYINNGSIKAANDITASSLITITDAAFVSITSAQNGVLDGSNKFIKAISIYNSSKIHLDNLSIINCKKGGVDFYGKSDKEEVEASSITRCNFQYCGDVAVALIHSFRFSFLDNTISYANVGIRLNSNNALIANNTIFNCAAAIEAISKQETITHNDIRNCGNGISLLENNFQSFIAYNKVVKNSIGFILNGKEAKLYYNTCDNQTELSGNGVGNEVFANNGITVEEVTHKGVVYFNPPLANNPHKDLIKIGKGRFDIDINGGAIADIQRQLKAAHNAHPKEVIVAHLTGIFVAQGKSDSLVIHEDECILLNGTIKSKAGINKFVNFSSEETVSFSGGIIEGDTTSGSDGLVFISGKAKAIVDGISILHSANAGIAKRNSAEALFVNKCIIESSRGKGIECSETANNFLYNNTITKSMGDGIGIVSNTTQAVLANNITANNKGSGILISEGSAYNLVINNKTDSNKNGINIFNPSYSSNSIAYNLLVANSASWNVVGQNISAPSGAKAVKYNTFINNHYTKNTEVGINGNSEKNNVLNNYFAWNNIDSNQLTNIGEDANFEANTCWNALDTAHILLAELLYFQQKQEKKGLQLSWATAVENSGSNFEVQCATFPDTFHTIATINALGKSKEKHKYEYVDTNINSGLVLYRLKLASWNKMPVYFNTLVVDKGTDSLFQMKFINMQNWWFKLVIKADAPVAINSIQLVDLSGKVAYQETIKNPKSSTAFEQMFRASNLLSGVYILKAFSDAGTEMKKVTLSRW